MKRYGVFNITKNKWLLDEDYQVVECWSIFDAEIELKKINELKMLNPRCKDYEYEIRDNPDTSQSIDLKKYENRN